MIDPMKEQYRKYLAKKLLFLRKQMKWEQKEVADQLDINLPRYKSYEEGRAEPNIFTLEKLCTIYALTVDNLLKDSPYNQAKNFSSHLI